MLGCRDALGAGVTGKEHTALGLGMRSRRTGDANPWGEDGGDLHSCRAEHNGERAKWRIIVG